MLRGSWSLLPLLFMTLNGCVEVNTHIGSRGKIYQELIITVPQRSARGTRQMLRDYLGRSWRIRVEGKGEQRVIRAWRKFPALDGGESMPGVSLHFSRHNDWFRATYHLTVSYDPSQLFQTAVEKDIVARQKITVRFFMPGRIVTTTPVGIEKKGNIAIAVIDPSRPFQAEVTAVGLLWWRLGLFLLALMTFLWFIAPYVPRLLERFPRRTVRIVGP